ncbi:MAG: class II aldolase/adducin family protein [Bacteroidetes bacterium]|nr:class II aldolase/adducin family protein [Bacteroidota bacterium]
MNTHDDGYVKYKMNWLETTEPLVLPEGLLTYRNKLVELGLIGVYPDQIGFGNISSRVSGNVFIISGTQTGQIKIANEMHFSQVNIVDRKTNSLYCAGPVAASSEAMTHAAIYAADAEINAVIHVHHFALWEKLKNIEATIPENIAYGTIEMAAAMENMVGEILAQQAQKLIITAGHAEGIFTFGENLDVAYNTLMQFYAALI